MPDRHKAHVCVYCKCEVARIHQHFMRRHRNEAEVKEILLINDSRQRLWAWKTLKQKGDFYYNKTVEDTAGEKKIVRVPTTPSKKKRYFTCTKCLGRLRTCSRAQHLNTCKNIFKSAEQVNQDVLEEDREDIFDGVPEGMINRIRSSPHLGNFLENSFNTEDRKTLGTTVSDLLRIEEGLEKITKQKYFLSHYLTPEHVDKVIRTIRNISGEMKKEKTIIFRFPSRAQRLCRLVSKLGGFLKIKYLKRKLDLEAGEVTNFLTLFEADAKKFIRTPAVKTLRLRKLSNPPRLPKTSQVERMVRKLQENTPDLLKNLERQPNEKHWRQLAENCLCRLTIFNRRRGGAVEKLKLSDFTNRRNTSQHLTEEAIYNLSEDEKEFLGRVKIIEVIHKNYNIVRIFITEDLESVMESLLRHRSSANLNPKNEYFFAAGRKTLNPIRGVRVMEKFREMFPPEERRKFTATNLRKHGATAAQLLELSPQDSEEWAAHMGHSLEVHKKYYRQTENITALLKTGKILFALNEGIMKFFKGKRVSELPLKSNGTDDPTSNGRVMDAGDSTPGTSNQGHRSTEQAGGGPQEQSLPPAEDAALEDIVEKVLCPFH